MNRVDLNRLCCQYTTEGPVEFNDHGLMSNRPVTMLIRPAPPGHGVVFVRLDLPAHVRRFRAEWSEVFAVQGCVMLHNASGHTVGPVEHVLSALAGIGIDNAEVIVDGPELPWLDGSTLPIVSKLIRHGIQFLPMPRDVLIVRRPVQVQLDGCWAALQPDWRSRLSLRMGRPQAPGTGRELSLVLTPADYIREIAPARAFGAGECEWRRQRVLDAAEDGLPAKVADNGEGVRFVDEFVRHKALDIVGILALVGAPVIGHLHASRPNHRVIVELVRTLLSDRSAWDRVTAMAFFDEHGQAASAAQEPASDWEGKEPFDGTQRSGYDGPVRVNVLSRMFGRARRGG